MGDEGRVARKQKKEEKKRDLEKEGEKSLRERSLGMGRGDDGARREEAWRMNHLYALMPPVEVTESSHLTFN